MIKSILLSLFFLTSLNGYLFAAEQQGNSNSSPTDTTQVVNASNPEPNIAPYHQEVMVQGAALYWQISQQKLFTFKLTELYHMLTVQDGSPKVQTQLKEATEQASTHLALLKQFSGDEDYQNDIQAVAKIWPKFSKLANSNQVKTQGYADEKISRALNQKQQEIIQQLNHVLERITEDSQVASTIKHKGMLIQAINLQRIATVYANSAASYNTIPMPGENNQPLQLDELAKDFTSSLKGLESVYEKNQAIEKVLNGIITKWSFIEDKIIDYKGSSIPFIVAIYSENIVEQLLETAEPQQQVSQLSQ